MGKLITFLFFFTFSMTIFGQGPLLHVHGTVADSDGISAPGVPVFISTAFSDSSFFFMDAITDDQGDYEVTIDVTSGDIQGVIFGAIPNCNGVLLAQSQSWQANNVDTVEIVMDFAYCENILIDSMCSVFIVEEIDPNGTRVLTALSPLWPINDVVEFLWSTGEEGVSITPQTEGTYCVTATFFDGCVATSCYDFFPDTNGFCSAYIDIVYSGIDSIAGGGNLATLNAIPLGTAPFIYTWDNGANTESILVGPGLYCVTIVDAAGCVSTACAEVVDFEFCEVFIVEDINSDGTPSLNAITPAFPISDLVNFEWSTGDIGPRIVPSVEGIYCVTATFFDGCTATSCYEFVPDTNGLCWTYIDVAYIAIDSVTGGGILASLSAIPAGTAPFTYAWNNGEATQTIIVPAGTYCVTTTDANGCSASSCVDVVDFEMCSVEIIETFGPTGPFGETILAAIIPPWLINDQVTFEWSTGETGQSIIPNESGVYCVTATFPDSCVATACYDYVADTIGNCWAFIEIEYGQTDSIGGGIFLPIATLVAEGYGEAPFTYEWDTGETGQSIQVEPGVYCVTITDANGCVAEACAEVIDFSFCEVFIGCDPPGSFQAIAFGIPPFNYLWSTGDTSMALNPTTPGEYCVTVTDATGCQVSSCAVFDTIPQIDSCLSFIIFNTDSSTVGSPLDTQITLTVLSFGTAPYTYEWNTGETTESIEVSDLTDIYCVTVTDATGCVSVACSDIWNGFCSSWIEVTYLDDGSAQLDVYTESGAPVMDWLWSNGGVGPSIIVNESGTYCATTIDEFGCTSEACAWVDFGIGSDSCFVIIPVYPDSINGMLIAEAISFGVAPFTYQWSDGSVANSTMISDPNVQLCVTVTDANGCVASACISDFVDPCEIYIEQDFSSADSAITLFASNPWGVFLEGQYLWSNGETTSSITVLQQGTYCVTATFENGCTSTACTEVDFFPIDTFTTYLSGFVIADIFAQLSGTVYAYAMEDIDSIDNTIDYVLADSTAMLDGNYYEFSNLLPGFYLIKAELADASPGFGDYFPTYHYNAVTWDDADPVFVPNWLTVTTDIVLQPINGGGGSGLISGSVLDPDGLIAEVKETTRSGGLAGIEIILVHQTAGNYRYTYTDEDGNFIFENLPWGTYKLTYDVIGLNAPEVWITIGPNNPENSDVLLNSGITTVATKEYTLSKAVKVFPNPTDNLAELRIDDLEGKIQVDIVSMQGQRLQSKTYHISKGEKIRLDLSKYKEGAYLIELLTDTGKATKMIMKQ